MATILQKKLAKAIVENVKREDPLNKKELLVSAGYKESFAGVNPGAVIEQKGVQEELEELGFNEHSAKKVVKDIMLSEKTDPSARLRATDQVFKVVGSYAPEEHKNLNINVSLTDLLKKAKEQNDTN